MGDMGENWFNSYRSTCTDKRHERMIRDCRIITGFYCAEFEARIHGYYEEKEY